MADPATYAYVIDNEIVNFTIEPIDVDNATVDVFLNGKRVFDDIGVGDYEMPEAIETGANEVIFVTQTTVIDPSPPMPPALGVTFNNSIGGNQGNQQTLIDITQPVGLID